MKNRIFAVILALALIFVFASCGKTTENGKAAVNVGFLAGPTGVGGVSLMEKAENGETENGYGFKIFSDNDEMIASVSSGETDIAAVATNMASALYNKTNKGISVIAVNTLGVLYIYSLDGSITDFASLKGKDVYMTGQGANPEYVFRYVAEKNGIDADKDLTLHFVADASELVTVFSKDKNAVVMAPQPVASNLVMKNPDAKEIFDMTKEWEKVSGGRTLVMGAAVVNNSFLENHKTEVDIFLKEYESSVEFAKANVGDAAALCEKYGIIPKTALAQKAIPKCGLTFMTGEEMKQNLSAYLNILYGFNKKAVGRSLPEDGFYYDKDKN